ncbi:MAG: hypothetical protein J6K74_00500 [Marinifilaceae bacterium]|nr:hypothetical protein [Marinifilaceae bacterium]
MDTERTELERTSQRVAQQNVQVENSSKGYGTKVAIGMTTGILMGGAASAGTMAYLYDNEDIITPEPEPGQIIYPEWCDGGIDIATSVTDDMSFGEAFAAARAEVGAGGAFVWHGNVYNTFTAEEWDAMSDEEIAEYNSHFDFSVNINTNTIEAEPEIITEPADDIPVIETTPEVELHGVVSDPESGVNVGVMTVDGQPVYLVDVNGDGGEFELAVTDVNGDGEITENEVLDISQEHIGVHEFNDHSLGGSNMYASADEVDYLNDDANV